MDVFIIGDLHGHYEIFKRLLIQGAFCNDKLVWTGGKNHLWLIGDLFDRGPDGLACLDLTMHLQTMAKAEGGSINMLMGNHEMMLLCAYGFGDRLLQDGMSVRDQWRLWGGKISDLEGLREHHVAWLKSLPLMARIEDHLLIHADSTFYVDFGHSVEVVNKRFADLIASTRLEDWIQTLNAFTEHKAFSSPPLSGVMRARRMLELYGAERLIHGHTPISIASGIPAREVTQAWTYADGLCINVDGGLYLGGPGFVYRLNQS